MNVIDNLYSSGPMTPVCQIQEHLAVWTDNQRWRGFVVDFIEPIPRSSAFVVDLIVEAGVGTLAPNGQISGRLLNVTRADSNELLHWRFFVLDDIEAQLWQLSNMARFASRGGQAGVTLFTPACDEWLASTTFWVLGGLGDKDARIGCTNISGRTLSQARVGFFGFRYIMTAEEKVHPNARYLPAQGR